MGKKLLEKLMESVRSVLPISVIVLVLHFSIAKMPLGTLALFLSGTVLLILGMSVFTLGVDMSMTPIGEHIGTGLTKSRKLWVLISGSLILGIIVTIAEPDLQVLTKQVPSVPDNMLVLSVAVGVGLFLVLAMMRILLNIRLAYVFLVLYALVFILAAFGDANYLGVAFDAGGVTTGPITVPFILALGSGVAVIRNDKSSEEDSFGLCAICSIGPVIAVLIMGLFYDSSQTGYAFETPESVSGIGELVSVYADGLLVFAKDVIIALTPVLVIFLLYQVIKLRLPKTQLIKILVGIGYILVGLTIFLTGVNIGFMPAGTFLGAAIASLPYNWILIPISMVIGFFIVAAEPAVHILNKQVEEVTSGSISRKMMMTGMSVGVAVALALAMIRIITGVSLWFFLLPGYAAALILAFIVPDIFTAIAFDSGGVVSGTMTAAFLLPFTLGACTKLGGNVMSDAFGIVALVATMPLVSIQVMGLLYKLKMRRINTAEAEQNNVEANEELPAETDIAILNAAKGQTEEAADESLCDQEDISIIEYAVKEDENAEL